MDEIRRIALPAMTLRVLGRELGIAVDHAPLALPPPGDVSDESVAAAYDGLAAEDLATGRVLRPEFDRALRLLADPEVAVTVSADLDDEEWSARAGFDGESAVLAEQVDGEVVVTRLPEPGWEAGLAALLPELHPAPGEPVTSVVDDSGREVDEHDSRIAHLPSSAGPTTVADVAAVLAAPRDGSGCFVVTTRESGTRPATPPLSWVATTRGAYAMTSTCDSGRTRTYYVPVDNAALGVLLGERIRQFRPATV